MLPARGADPHGSIAICGVGAIFPDAVDKTSFWHNILAGKDSMTDVPPTHWSIDDYYDPDPSVPDKSYARRGAFLPSIDFNGLEFGIPPNNIPQTDTAQLLALIVARQVLDDASRGQFHKLDRDRISVILGVASATELVAEMSSRLQKPIWLKALREGGVAEDQAQDICARILACYVPWQESTFPGLLGNVVAGRIANRLDLHGTNCVVDAACASSLSALAMAIGELRLGSSDLAIVGGVDALNNIFMYTCFSKTSALSASGDCRPFSDNADGTMLGEGIAMFALRRLEDAQRDGDPIYAVLRGLGSSSDGSSKSVYAPTPDGQALALARAYEGAGFGPDTVELVEAHGTATKAGDLAEFRGLCKVYDASRRVDRQWCALGSVKSQIGHTKAAAGAAGLFKAVMALHHKILPPTIKVDRPNPELGFDTSPFYLNTQARPWIRSGAHPRRVAVSSFGFGGSNFHAVLEEFDGPGASAAKLRTFDSELILLSAESPLALAEQSRAMADDIIGPASVPFMSWRSQKAFDARRQYRLAIVASDDKDLKDKLERAIASLQRGDATFSDPRGIYVSSGTAAGPVAFLFPGQGSQYVEMGAALAMAFDVSRSAWDEAAGPRFAGGRHLRDVVFPVPVFTDAERAAQQAELTETQWAQPALGVASLSFLRIMNAIGVRPAYVAGHSFGEVTALHAAGVLSAADFLTVSRMRGELIAAAARAAPGGAMTAGSIAANLLAEVSSSHPGVTVANYNSPSQTVLSGDSQAIERVERFLEERGVSCRRLPVSTAFHSPLVASACEPFASFLDNVRFDAHQTTVFSNATAQAYPQSADAMRTLLAQQIAQPVYFAHQLEAIYAAGARIFVEVGPGNVLTARVGECLSQRPHLAVSLDRKGLSGLTALWHALGQLAASGVVMQPHALWEGYAEPVDPRSVKKSAMCVQISGVNHGKPYPFKPQVVEPATSTSPIPGSAMSHNPVQLFPVSSQASASEEKSGPQNIATTMRSSDLFAMLADVHRQTTDVQLAFQRSLAEGHALYLKAMGSVLQDAQTLLQLVPPDALPALRSVRAIQASQVTYAAKADSEPEQSPVTKLEDMATLQQSVEPHRAESLGPPVVVPLPTPPALQGHGSERREELIGLLLSVVSEKTGYPVDVLGLRMELESELGIDSTKRVEILSAMQSRLPDVPEAKAREMAAMRTLGEIVDSMDKMIGDPTAAVVPVAPAAVASTASAATLNIASPAVAKAEAASEPASVSPSTPDAAALTTLLLSVISEKTGYPVDVLDVNMELEGELGIDSIKRVEILAAMRSRLPDMPEAEASDMAALRTIGEIVHYMDGMKTAEKKRTAEPARMM